MESDRTSSVERVQDGLQPVAARLLLGVDTCGPTGSVALGRLTGESIEILEQIELEGRSYSATLVAAVGELLAHARAQLKALDAIVAVNGPGSFTGVRVGLSAAKGLAEAAQIPVVAISRLEVLAWKAGVESSALDAHRNEVFLRLGVAGVVARELLAGADDLAALQLKAIQLQGGLQGGPTDSQIALCDDAAAALLSTAWPGVQQVRTEAPTAADALQLCAARVAATEFVDLALLDGHYLRRSDAEIFAPAISEQSRARGA
jgi:tRNA threonylcarbamoyladenosine biosynthesis protein TsaB